MSTLKTTMPKQYGRVLVQPATLDAEAREVDVVFATETAVRRFGWEEDYDEVLVCDPSAVRMERANRGLPVMDCHNTFSVFDQLGRTVKVWFNESRELCARVRFSSRAKVAELFADIEVGIVKDISVGYQVFKFEREEMPDDKIPIYRAVDWMPTELSFAPVQADINSEVRSTAEGYTVEIISQTNTKNTMKRSIQYTVDGAPVAAGDTVTVDGTEYTAETGGDVGETITLNEREGGDDDSSIEYTVEGGDVAAGDTVTVDGTEYTAETGGAVGETITLTLVAGRSGGNPPVQKKQPSNNARMNTIMLAVRATGLPQAEANALVIELHQSKRSIDECRAEIIRRMAKRSAGGAVSGHLVVGMGRDNNNTMMGLVQEAILHRTMPSKFQLSDGARQFRGMTLVEMGKDLLASRGVSVRGMSRAEVADRFFGRAHGTSDFPLLFEGVIDKMLRTEYEFAPEFWENIARKTTVADFRARGLYQVGSKNGMKEAPEGSEIKYTTLEESKNTIRVKSYAEGISFTRQAFINDDLSALSIIPSHFVKDWDELRGSLVWSLLINNAQMSDGKELFCANHGNMLTGASSVLSEESLAEGKTLFAKQRSIDGRIIRVMPKFLIVPPELEVAAKKLITAITPVKSADVNVFANEFSIIVEPRLTKPTEWYLSADPNAVDSLYYAYLEGSEQLRVDTKEDFDTDAMKYAVRGDFGVAAIDHRGLVKAIGKA